MKKILLLTAFLLLAALLSLGCTQAEEAVEETTPELEATAGSAGEEPLELPSEQQEQTENDTAESDGADILTGGAVAELKEGETHFVELTGEGFVPDKLTIKKGDTVVWQNVRSGQIDKALVIGVRQCAKVRSKFLEPGDSFSWTFDEAVKCTFVDGVMTTVESNVVVE